MSSTNIFEDKTYGDKVPLEPSGQTAVAMDTREVPGQLPLPGERRNPAMAIVNIERPRFGYKY